MKCMQLIVKYFSYQIFYFYWLSYIWINTFTLGRRVLFEASSQIRIILHSGKCGLFGHE
jgi:hypothetical protein